MLCTRKQYSEYQHSGHYLPTEREVDTECWWKRMRSNYIYEQVDDHHPGIVAMKVIE